MLIDCCISVFIGVSQVMRPCEDATDPSNASIHVAGEIAVRLLKSKIKDAASLTAPTSTDVYLPPTLFRPVSSRRASEASFVSKVCLYGLCSAAIGLM